MNASALKRKMARIAAVALLASAPSFAYADDSITFSVLGDNSTLASELEAASLLRAAAADSSAAPSDILAAALADYTRMVDTLYANGYFGGVVHIRIGGQEAANMSVFTPPANITDLSIEVDPGTPFHFGVAQVAPLAPNTTLPSEFAEGEVAASGAVQAAVEAAVGAWRSAGYPKISLTAQNVSANHNTHTLSARVQLAPGPLVHFGQTVLTGESAVRAARILRIAGLPEGEVFSPETLADVAKRLRRSGAFSSVSLEESETLGDDNSMDILLSVVDAKPRRVGFGAEIASLEGLTLSAYWQHRNLFGGAEQFRIDGEIAGITPDGDGVDYRLGLRLEQPATFGPNTSAFLYARGEILNEPAYYSKHGEIGVGLTQIFSDFLTAEMALELGHTTLKDSQGDHMYNLVSLPTTATWDHRDDPLDAKSGFYLEAGVTPYTELRAATFGARLTLDGRAYKQLGPSGRFALAGRVQAGVALDGTGNETPADFLFYSGGGSTVRGQPYQSLNVDLGGGDSTGGHSFLGLSGELRAQISESFGVVGFADAGYIDADSFYAGDGNWHAGAGLGVRYFTGIGPIRFDVALPINGTTGAGVQLYLGIGQAF